MTRPQILIAGGGYVGFYTARGLEKALAPGEADVTVVSPQNFMLYQPLLPEVASGALEPRHAVVPLRSALRRTEVVTGLLSGLDLTASKATVSATGSGDGTAEQTLGYDHLVVALGSMTKVLPVPGLVGQATGFTSLAEAIELRDRVLRRLEAAETLVGAARRRALTFVFVGGGYTGVEALAELRDMALEVVRDYPGLSADDLRFILLEASDRLLPNLTEALAGDALAELRRQGVEVRLSTQVDDATDGVLRLSDGDTVETDTLVWVAGVVPNTVDGALGLPTDDQGRILVDDRMRVRDTPGVWSAGDCAAVPDLVAGGTCAPTAQYAVREGRRLARNIVAVLRGEEPLAFRYTNKGSFVALGKRQGVASLMGVPVRGLPAWVARRGYYATQIPTANRKARVVLDWVASAPFGHDVVDLGSGSDAAETFAGAARRQLSNE